MEKPFGWDVPLRAAMQTHRLRGGHVDTHETWLSDFNEPLVMAHGFASVARDLKQKGGQQFSALLTPLATSHENENMTQYVVRKTLHALSCAYPSFAPALASSSGRDVALVGTFSLSEASPRQARCVYRRLLAFGLALAHRVDESTAPGANGFGACVDAVLLDPLLDVDDEPLDCHPSIVTALALGGEVATPKGLVECDQPSVALDALLKTVAACVANTACASIDAMLVQAMHTSIRIPGYELFLKGVWNVATAFTEALEAATHCDTASDVAGRMVGGLCANGDVGELEDFVRCSVGLPAHQPPVHPRHRARYLIFKAALAHVQNPKQFVRAVIGEADGRKSIASSERAYVWVMTLCLCTREAAAAHLLSHPHLASCTLSSLRVDASALPMRVATPLDLLAVAPGGMLDDFCLDSVHDVHDVLHADFPNRIAERATTWLAFVENAALVQSHLNHPAGDVLKSIYRLCSMPFDAVGPCWRRARRRIDAPLEAALRAIGGGAVFDPADGRGRTAQQLRECMTAALADEAYKQTWCRADRWFVVVTTWRAQKRGTLYVHCAKVLMRAFREAPNSATFDCEMLLRKECGAGEAQNVASDENCDGVKLVATSAQSARTWANVKLAWRLDIARTARLGVYCHAVSAEDTDEGG